jgi:molecular chaperone DnaK
MNSAGERLQQASHKIAEVMYRSAASSSGGGPGASASAGSSGAGKEDEVIDTEYVDTEKK